MCHNSWDYILGFVSGMMVGVALLFPLYCYIIHPAMQRFMDKAIRENK